MSKSWLLFSLFFALSACKSVPLTNRRQLSFIPNSQLTSLSLDQYGQVLSSSKLLHNTPESEMVKRVGQRIAQAVEDYLRSKGHAEMIKDFNWEFNLIDDPSVNAWCMPGGKVAFYTGILPICNGEAGIAVVMGHEVAHAVARHGNERMSQALLQQAGGVALNVALRDQPEQTQQLYNSAYGIASQLGAILPFSRLHESEADEMGLIFMAMAGYDPREAPKFWERMAAGSGGAPPEFLSTHPSHNRRVEDLNKNMAKAVVAYQKAQGQ